MAEYVYQLWKVGVYGWEWGGGGGTKEGKD